MTKSELINKIGKNGYNWFASFRECARDNGFSVRLSIHEGGNTGDFTIFIYDKSVKTSYMVGFDGYFCDINFTFDTCCRMAEKWMKKYMKEKN